MRCSPIVSFFLPLLTAAGILTGCSNEARLMPPPTPSAEETTISDIQPDAAEETESAAIPEPTAPLTPPATWKIPILVYHHIRPQQGWAKTTWSWKMTVTPETFERHMQWLADHGYTGVSLDTFVQIVRGERAGPEKPVVITFDDNQMSAYEIGVPVMEKYGQRGVFYLVTDRLDTPGLIGRKEIPDLLARGMDVQSHTIAHRVLTALPVAELDRDLAESKRVLEEATGRPVLHLAYPGTAHNATVRERAKLAGYVTATIMDPRPATQDSDMYRLPRIMMTDDTDLGSVLP